MNKKLSEKILTLDDWTCRACGKRTFLSPPHHIIYKSRGGPDEDWNLITLCITCHDKVHNGVGRYEGRRTGRQEMIRILKKLEDVVGYRWGKAYQMLRMKVSE